MKRKISPITTGYCSATYIVKMTKERLFQGPMRGPWGIILSGRQGAMSFQQTRAVHSMMSPAQLNEA